MFHNYSSGSYKDFMKRKYSYRTAPLNKSKNLSYFMGIFKIILKIVLINENIRNKNNNKNLKSN